jgi:hypothetical protein
MTQYTISDQNGRSYTTTGAGDLWREATVWLSASTTAEDAPRVRRLAELFYEALDKGQVGRAGALANSLKLNFAWSAGRTRDTYPEPEIDPADATNCEACQ